MSPSLIILQVELFLFVFGRIEDTKNHENLTIRYLHFIELENWKSKTQNLLIARIELQDEEIFLLGPAPFR